MHFSDLCVLFLFPCYPFNLQSSLFLMFYFVFIFLLRLQFQAYLLFRCPFAVSLRFSCLFHKNAFKYFSFHFFVFFWMMNDEFTTNESAKNYGKVRKKNIFPFKFLRLECEFLRCVNGTPHSFVVLSFSIRFILLFEILHA